MNGFVIHTGNTKSAYCGLMLLFFLGACSVFDTREAEPPDRGDSIPFIQPDQPEDVIENLQNAVKSLSLQNYLRSLNDLQFEYTPTGVAQNSDPNLWAGWSLDDEEAYFNNLRAASENFSGHQLQLEIQDNVIIDNTRQITAYYTLTMIHNVDVPSVARGTMRLTLSAGEDGQWSIESWADISDDDAFSWSDLRATFR